MSILKSRSLAISYLLIGIAFLVGSLLFPTLPEKMASHWNMVGEVDGHISKFWGVYLFPTIMLGITLLLYFIPNIDPLKKNVDSFRSYYDHFILVFNIFFLYVYLLTLAWNKGYSFDIGPFVVAGVGIFFIYLGALLPHTKRNWFIGIRTPWTLSSDEVWRKTHEMGGTLFKLVGVLFMLSPFLPVSFFPYIIVTVVALLILLVLYSYLEFRKEKMGV